AHLLKQIEGDIYGKEFATNMLLKLDFLLTNNNFVEWLAFGQLSVEHILPENPSERSRWTKNFTNIERAELTNKMGNLILLGRPKNASFGKMDYKQKRKKYFQGKVSNFPNS